MSAQILDKDEVVDFISDLIDKRISETFSKHMLLLSEINVEEFIKKLHIDVRRSDVHGGFEIVIADLYSGYSKIIPTRGF